MNVFLALFLTNDLFLTIIFCFSTNCSALFSNLLLIPYIFLSLLYFTATYDCSDMSIQSYPVNTWKDAREKNYTKPMDLMQHLAGKYLSIYIDISDTP